MLRRLRLVILQREMPSGRGICTCDDGVVLPAEDNGRHFLGYRHRQVLRTTR